MSNSGMESETLVDEGGGAASPATPGEGERIGRYMILERLGSGGMGVVYCAFDPELNRKVAIKVLGLRSDGPRSEVASARLIREAQAIAQLTHPNVIAVHDVGEIEDSVFVAMEFVDGVTLGAWLEEGSRPWSEVLDVFLQAGRGLAAAHDHELVHRDFKPDNVMIGTDGRVRVLDFGLARHMDAPDLSVEPVEPSGIDHPVDLTLDSAESQRTDALSARLTRVGAVIGTPAYMAPEQHLGETADARSDQFSFCVALYQGLFGHRPFRASTRMELVEKVTSGRPEPPPASSRVPPRIRRAILRGLAARPEGRWPSMHNLLQELDRDPLAWLRRWGAVGSLALGGVAVAVALGAGADQPCQDTTGLLDGAWDASRRDAVQGALLATDRGYAAETWTRVEKGLDAYAGAWVAARTDACEATHVRHEQSSQLLDARMRCLAGRRRALAAVTEALSSADTAALENAVSSVRGLPTLDPCADPEYVTAAVPPPEDEATRSEVESIRTELARARALRDTGSIPKALEVADAAAERAGALDYPPLRAETDLALGSIRQAASNYDGAESALRRAFFDGRRTSHDDVTAQASTQLVSLVGERLRRKDEALWWAEHARAEIDRRPHVQLDADLLNNLGATRYAAGEFEEAQDLYTRALERRRASLGEQDPQVALSLNNLSKVLYRLARYEEAMAHHEEALQIIEDSLGPGHPEMASTLTSLGNVHYREKRLDQALELYERALAIREAALGKGHAGIAVSLNNIGNIHDARRDYATALDFYRRAVALLEENLGPDHPDVASSLANVANCHEGMGQLDEALELHTRALEIKRKTLGDDHHSVGYSHNGLGTVHYKRGDHEAAVAAYAQALAVWEKRLGADHPLLVYALRGQGRSLVALGRAVDAIAPLERAVELRKKAGSGPEDLAEPSFTLATALWDARRDRARAVEIARTSLAAFEAADDDESATEVRQWLQARSAL